MVLHPVGFWLPPVIPFGTVVVSGETVSQVTTTNKAGIAFYGGSTSSPDRRGEVWKIENTTYTQVDISTDWVRPTTSARADYSIKATITSDVGGDPGLTAGSSSTGTWISMAFAAEIDWFVQAASLNGADSKDVTLLIEISEDGGSTTEDSGSYRLISGTD